MEDIFALSDKQIQERIGSRLRAARLKQNITQLQLAHSAGLSLSSVKKIENGNVGTFESLLRVLRILGRLDVFQTLVEEDSLSPAEYYALQNASGKNQRKRAAGRIKAKEEVSEW